MSRQQSPNTYPPLTDSELAVVEQRAHTLPKDWPRDEMLRLIAEVRLARAARTALQEQTAAVPDLQDLVFPSDDTPPGGRVTMAEWQVIAARLEAERGPLPEPRRLSSKEREERQRRWKELHAQMGWDTQAPLTPEQETSLDTLIQEEIQAHRRQKQRKRERHAGGR